ncbi:3-methyl-2-oxobutanoate hydroxymethyltransferase [Thermithiobacillus plumbiphilus]|uniref:3-methyl-2-oxobutanoate hydroxymethyltransferase n=1 Tax=Thermithiobacillus plumbiphilus TaxID=1729899 RepID=A0ABU9D9X5_9PROT
MADSDKLPARVRRQSLIDWDRARGKQTLAVLTAYDYTFARLADRAGADALLVGDSLGMTFAGEDNTLSVTLEQMVYHTRAVARGRERALLISDLPFLSYQESPEQALRSAGELLRAGAEVVKLEGGAVMAETVAFLSARGIPVCGHIGLTPQSVHQLGGYRQQGRDEVTAARLREDARQLVAAGARLLVLEAMPADLAAQITAESTVPTIGIGAGPHCDAQVLVMQDVLGLFLGQSPGFVRRYLEGAALCQDALARFVDDVHQRAYPGSGEG